MKTKRLKKSNPLLKDAWQLYVMMAVPLLLVFIFNYLPMGGIIIAFKNYNYQDGIFGSEWCWFKNFEFFFASSDFANITWNTIYMNAIFIVTGTLGALCVGVLLYQLSSRKATKIFQTMLITPHVLSWVVAAYMVYAI